MPRIAVFRDVDNVLVDFDREPLRGEKARDLLELEVSPYCDGPGQCYLDGNSLVPGLPDRRLCPRKPVTLPPIPPCIGTVTTRTCSDCKHDMAFEELHMKLCCFECGRPLAFTSTVKEAFDREAVCYECLVRFDGYDEYRRLRDETSRYHPRWGFVLTYQQLAAAALEMAHDNWSSNFGGNRLMPYKNQLSLFMVGHTMELLYKALLVADGRGEALFEAESKRPPYRIYDEVVFGPNGHDIRALHGRLGEQRRREVEAKLIPLYQDDLGALRVGSSDGIEGFLDEMSFIDAPNRKYGLVGMEPVSEYERRGDVINSAPGGSWWAGLMERLTEAHRGLSSVLDDAYKQFNRESRAHAEAQRQVRDTMPPSYQVHAEDYEIVEHTRWATRLEELILFRFYPYSGSST